MDSQAVGEEGIRQSSVQLVAIWIDWYAYHIARFRGLTATPALSGRLAGIEMVGGEGVHAGLRFREELPPELPVTTLAPNSSWISISSWKLSWLVWKKLASLDSAAVLVPGYYTLPALTAALWAKSHNRLSILMTESTAADHDRSWWKEVAKRIVLRSLFDRAVSGGRLHRRYLTQLHFPEEHVARCYDVVDNEGIALGVEVLRSSHKPEDFSLPDSCYFLYVGRLAEEKNVDMLLSAWSAYRSEGGTWPLVLVGNGPKRKDLEATAKGLKYGDEVVFAGHRRSHELSPFYAFAGCFVLPSVREPWGLVVNEAMAAGLPVLVSSICGCVEDLVLTGSNGFHFNPGSSEELCSLLLRVGALPVFDREQMGKASSELIKAYSPQCFGAEIASLMGV